jgi:pre-mRNA-splicing helicase BRR2
MLATGFTLGSFGLLRAEQISEIYPHPVTAANKAASVLSILGSELSLHDCENQLMELIEYQSFHTMTKFLKNRNVDERVNIEVVM